MNVEMKHGLTGAGADVEDGAVSLLEVALAGDLGGGEVAAADDFGVGGLGFFESGKMFFGDDQDVSGGLRVDVFEGEDVVVLVDFVGGDFAAEDAAEEAIGIGHFLFTSRTIISRLGIVRRAKVVSAGAANHLRVFMARLKSCPSRSCLLIFFDV
jgi:hypothetical protein